MSDQQSRQGPRGPSDAGRETTFPPLENWQRPVTDGTPEEGRLHMRLFYKHTAIFNLHCRVACTLVASTPRTIALVAWELPFANRRCILLIGFFEFRSPRNLIWLKAMSTSRSLTVGKPHIPTGTVHGTLVDCWSSMCTMFQTVLSNITMWCVLKTALTEVK